MNDNVLLFGNGINNLNNNSYMWIDLLNDLKNYTNFTGNDDLPFPLLYEKIFIHGLKNNTAGNYEGRIKKYIANKVKDFQPNQIHKKFIQNTNFNNILTTNYDYSFEKALKNDIDDLQNSGIINERYYSLFRHIRINDKKIWHIHGEANHFFTITLGYNHYCNYLHNIIGYIATGTHHLNKKKKILPVVSEERLNEMKIEHLSWTDFFFSKNVFIIGLTLNYIESHLWWLINYRTRCIFEKKLPIDNNIYYFFPEEYKDDKIKSKLDLLKEFNINVISIDKSVDTVEFYNDIYEKIANGM